MASNASILVYMVNSTVDGHNNINITDNNLEEDNSMFLYYLWMVAVPVIFSFIIFIGVIGNVMVITVILTNRKMKNLTNILLFNLAVADLTFLVICVPFQAYKYASLVFPFGDLVCKIAQYLLFVTAYITVYTLVAIAALRYATVVISHRTLRYRTDTSIVITCIVIWIAILICNIPTLFSHQVTIIDEYISYCGVVQDRVEPLFMSFFLCGYVIPLSVISLFYMLILIHLKQNAMPQQAKSNNAQGSNRKAHAFKVIIIVIAVFGISWLPLHIHNITQLYGNTLEGKWYEVLRILWHCMAYGNSLVNPFIYTYASSEFRKAFKYILLCVCLRRQYRECGDGQIQSTCTEAISLQTSVNSNKPKQSQLLNNEQNPM